MHSAVHCAARGFAIASPPAVSQVSSFQNCAISPISDCSSLVADGRVAAGCGVLGIALHPALAFVLGPVLGGMLDEGGVK